MLKEKETRQGRSSGEPGDYRGVERKRAMLTRYPAGALLCSDDSWCIDLIHIYILSLNSRDTDAQDLWNGLSNWYVHPSHPSISGTLTRRTHELECT